jgi:hypothetical protein
MGVTAAIASALLFMSAHGRPRFASTITDQGTIRAAFLLGLLAAVAAAATSWWARETRRTRSVGASAERSAPSGARVLTTSRTTV